MTWEGEKTKQNKKHLTGRHKVQKSPEERNLRFQEDQPELWQVKKPHLPQASWETVFDDFGSILIFHLTQAQLLPSLAKEYLLAYIWVDALHSFQPPWLVLETYGPAADTAVKTANFALLWSSQENCQPWKSSILYSASIQRRCWQQHCWCYMNEIYSLHREKRF